MRVMPLGTTGTGRAAPSEICRTAAALSIKRAVLLRRYYGDHAALLFLMFFDMSTHGDWHTVATLLPQGLEAALEDLRGVPAEAAEEGYPQPTQLALSNAKRILRRMYALFGARLEVYPTQDGEVAIVAPGKPRSSVMVLCGPEGGALCMVNMDGVHRRARYSTAANLPDGFLRDALDELANRGG